MIKTKINITGFLIIIFTFNMNLNAQNLYFSTPEESVEICSKLLIERNWDLLITYYDLENCSEEITDAMKNGTYFMRKEQPDVAHPAGFWQYKKPFPPSYKYFYHTETETNILEVTVFIEIDQGEGMMQQGLATFKLIRSENGYQLLP